MEEKINHLLTSRKKKDLDLAIQLVTENQLQETFYYLSRFGEMLNYIKQFDNIDLVEYKFLPPNLDHIDKIEKEIGKVLDIGVKTFYQQCGGLILFWVDKRNPRYEMIKNSYQQDICVDGSIVIYNLNAIYHETPPKTYGREWEFRGETLAEEEISKKFHQFDYFSDYRDMMAYTGKEFINNPVLVMGDDHGIIYTDSRLIHIPEYIEFMFHSCGVVDSRKILLGSSEGHKKPVLKLNKAFFNKKARPDFNEYPYSIFHLKE